MRRLNDARRAHHDVLAGFSNVFVCVAYLLLRKHQHTVRLDV